jgi:hypothetical protein
MLPQQCKGKSSASRVSVRVFICVYLRGAEMGQRLVNNGII